MNAKSSKPFAPMHKDQLSPHIRAQYEKLLNVLHAIGGNHVVESTPYSVILVYDRKEIRLLADVSVALHEAGIVGRYGPMIMKCSHFTETVMIPIPFDLTEPV